MHGDTQIHFLGTFQNHMLMISNQVARQKKVQSGITEKVISALVKKLGKFLHLFLGIVL